MAHLPSVHTTPLHRVGVEGVRGKGGVSIFSSLEQNEQKNKNTFIFIFTDDIMKC